MLHVMQPRRCRPRLSISTSGRLHSKQRDLALSSNSSVFSPRIYACFRDPLNNSHPLTISVGSGGVFIGSAPRLADMSPAIASAFPSRRTRLMRF